MCPVLWQEKTTHKIVATRSERLHDSHLVAPQRARAVLDAEPPHEHERSGPHHAKVQDHGDKHPEDGPEVVQDVVPLVGEHHENGVEQADEGERREHGEKALLEEVLRCQAEDQEACYEP